VVHRARPLSEEGSLSRPFFGGREADGNGTQLSSSWSVNHVLLVSTVIAFRGISER